MALVNDQEHSFRNIFEYTPYEINNFIGEEVKKGVASKEHPEKDDYYLYLIYRKRKYSIAERKVKNKEKEIGELIWGAEGDFIEIVKKVDRKYNKNIKEVKV